MLKPCLICGTLSEGSYSPDHGPGGSTRAWRKLRNRILERDRRRCKLCGATPATELDHLILVTDGGPDEPNNCRGVCHGCHAGRHRHR